MLLGDRTSGAGRPSWTPAAQRARPEAVSPIVKAVVRRRQARRASRRKQGARGRPVAALFAYANPRTCTAAPPSPPPLVRSRERSDVRLIGRVRRGDLSREAIVRGGLPRFRAPRLPRAAFSGAQPLHEATASVRGSRTNQTPCTILTTAVFADLVRAAQSARAGPPRLKRLAPESSPCRKRTKSRDRDGLCDGLVRKQQFHPSPKRWRDVPCFVIAEVSGAGRPRRRDDSGVQPADWPRSPAGGVARRWCARWSQAWRGRWPASRRT